jgi:hypothetical protein
MVKRYEPVIVADGVLQDVETDHGRWVPFTDYDALAARLAEATALLDEAYSHGDTDDWAARTYAFLRPTVSASVAPELTDEEQRAWQETREGMNR